MSFTIQRILGIAPVMVLGLLLLTPAPGLAQVAKPDLVVNSLVSPPGDALPGDSFVVTASVKNKGTVAAGASITRFILVSTPGAPEEEPQGRAKRRSPWPGSQRRPRGDGDHLLRYHSRTVFLQACANRGDTEVVETNATNKHFQTTAQITVSDVPDLVMTAITEPPL